MRNVKRTLQNSMMKMKIYERDFFAQYTILFEGNFGTV